MIIHYCIETGYVKCDINDEFEMPDDATDEEIEEAVNDAIWNYISFNWWKDGEHN